MDARAATRWCGEGLDLTYCPGFAAADQAQAWFEALLHGIDWRQEQVRVFGRSHPAPRLTAWHGDHGVRYRYSGVEHVANGWTDVLAEIRALVQSATGAHFNAVLLNRYRDGSDTVSWHSDDEAALGPRPVIASVSLGGTRRFCLRRRAHAASLTPASDAHADGRALLPPPDRHELLLGHGSLMVMRGETQRAWQHCVPRCAGARPRINLTFRRVQPCR